MTEYILSQAVTIILYVGFIVILARRSVRRNREFVDSLLQARQVAAERFDRETAARAALIPEIDVAALLAPALARLAAVPPLPDPGLMRTFTDEAIKRLRADAVQTDLPESLAEGSGLPEDTLDMKFIMYMPDEI